jgi:gas vesicle protein
MTDDERLEELEEEDEAAEAHHSTRTFLAGLAIGALVGAGVALLFAPKSGAETRLAVARRAKIMAREAREKYDDVREKVRRARRGAAAHGDDATDD